MHGSLYAYTLLYKAMVDLESQRLLLSIRLKLILLLFSSLPVIIISCVLTSNLY